MRNIESWALQEEILILLVLCDGGRGRSRKLVSLPQVFLVPDQDEGPPAP